MEFNNNKITGVSITEAPVLPTSTEKVILKSTERASVNTLTNSIKVDVTKNTFDTVLVTHDVKDITNSFSPTSIKTSLVDIYGKDGRLFSSARTLESAEIPLSQYPARLEYKLVVVENGIEVEYNTSQLLSSEPSTVLSSLTGKSTSSKSELTIPEAVSSIDDELVKFKNSLESFSYIYDNSQNKVVTLHSYIQSMNTKLNNLTKQLEDVAEKTKDL
jgi:hypothetical protein